MKEQLEQIKAKALADLAAAADMSALDAVRVRVLGKKGELTAVLKQMGKLSAEERPVMGQMANAVRAKLEDALEKRRTALDAAALESKLEAEAVDVTIPGKPVEMGHQHPMNRVLQEVKEIFPEQEIVMDPLSLSVSCHIGPGALAVACTKKLW